MDEAERLAREWLEHALDDLVAADTHHRSAELAPRTTCWFAQQAVEKAMKSLLVLDQIEYPLSRDLAEIHRLLPRPLASASRHNLKRLSEFAIQARYPGPWPRLERADAETALAAAHDVLEEVRERFDQPR